MPLRESEAPVSLENSEELKTQMQAKWHPMTHAIYNGNLDLVKYLFSESKINSKKAIKPMKKAKIYPLKLFARTLPTAASVAANDVRRMKVVDTGILKRVRIKRKTGAAI